MVLIALAGLGGQAVSLLLQKTESVGLVELLALGGGDVVLGPLPQLAAGDFGGSGVLLQGG